MSIPALVRASRALLLASVCASALVSPAAAEVAAIRQADTVIVLGERTVSAAAQAEAARQPGNVSVVPAEAFADRYAVTFRDTLQFTPGVIAQPRFGEEVRLSIRGSGVANNAHLRGVELQFDGVPLNGADGFGDFQEIDPTFTAALSVYRGANAFALAGATLGGAIAIEGLRARRPSIVIAYFHARLENEFIAFQVSPLIPAATFNAPKTRRHGLEAGGTARLADDVFGGALSLRGAWTYNRFRFEDDPVYGDNALAGVPDSTLVGELAWEAGPWRIAPSVFTQSDTTVDFRNTLAAPGYTLVNLSASWQAGPNTRLFLEGRNLADEAHVSMVSAIANARAPGVNLAVATPGEGRAFYLGLRTGFGGRP